MERIHLLKKFFNKWHLNVKNKKEYENKKDYDEYIRECLDEREYAIEHYNELYDCYYIQYYNEDYDNYEDGNDKLYGDYEDWNDYYDSVYN